MAVKTGWSNTVLGNAVVVVGSGAIFVTLYALGAPLYTAVVMVVGAGLILLDQHLDQKQHREFAQFADQHGWTHTRHTREYAERFTTYPFGVGVKRNQTGVLAGLHQGHYCVTFTHHWTDNPEPGKQSQTHDFQVTFVEFDADFPRLDVVPANVGSLIERLVGGKAVDLYRDDFSQRWNVRTQDPGFAGEVLTADMVERLLAPDTQNQAFRLEGKAVMMWQTGGQGPEGLLERVDLLLSLAGHIPTEFIAAPSATPQAAGSADSTAADLLDDEWQQQWFADEQDESP